MSIPSPFGARRIVRPTLQSIGQANFAKDIRSEAELLGALINRGADGSPIILNLAKNITLTKSITIESFVSFYGPGRLIAQDSTTTITIGSAAFPVAVSFTDMFVFHPVADEVVGAVEIHADSSLFLLNTKIARVTTASGTITAHFSEITTQGGATFDVAQLSNCLINIEDVAGSALSVDVAQIDHCNFSWGVAPVGYALTITGNNGYLDCCRFLLLGNGSYTVTGTGNTVANNRSIDVKNIGGGNFASNNNV